MTGFLESLITSGVGGAGDEEGFVSFDEVGLIEFVVLEPGEFLDSLVEDELGGNSERERLLDVGGDRLGLSERVDDECAPTANDQNEASREEEVG